MSQNLQRWQSLLADKCVIPFEKLPMSPVDFQNQVATALHSLGKKIYDLEKINVSLVEKCENLQQELRRLKREKMDKKIKMVNSFDDAPAALAVGNSFDGLEVED